jgi:hypothetical protein
MPRILTKLRISEVSAVDAGAGDGTKVVLMKRDDDVPRSKPHLERYQRRLRKLRESRSFNAIIKQLDDQEISELSRDDSGGGGGGTSDHHASTVADLLVEAGSHPDRASALSHLLHSPHGQALLQRMHKAADQTAKETTPMTTSHNELVQDIVKRFGIVALAKSMVQDQKSYGLDEHTFTRLATEHAQRVYPNFRPDSAFSKLYESEESVRRACQIAKAQTLEPVMVGGPDATHEAINNTEQSEAYQQLVDMAEKLRAESPFLLSADQAFARVFENPKHAAIAAKAHRRPSATTSYEWPR